MNPHAFRRGRAPSEGTAATALGEEAGAAGESGAQSAEAALANDGCFVAGKLVQIGSTRPIEQVQVGDRVWSRHEKTGKNEAQTVSATIHHQSHVVIHLSLQDTSTGRTEEIIVSAEHPFYVDGKGWVVAAHLGIGAQIVTRAGPKLTVKSVRTESTAAGYTLYNLTVDSDHTYFVGKVDGGAWVHNVTCPLVVTDPATGNAITDIDEIEGNVLWEHKSASSAGDTESWLDKHINGKLDSYLRARQHIPGHEDADIGFRFTESPLPEFRSAVESRIDTLRTLHPDVNILLHWAE